MSTVPSPPRSSSSSRQTSPRRTRVCRPHKSSSSVSSVHSFHLPSRITVSASSSSNSIRSTHTPSSSTSSAFFNSPTETSPDQTRTRTSSNGSEPHVLLPSVFVEGGMNEEGVMYPPSSYVQAEYAFEPAESGSYLSFERGEIIRIVNRDASGWWDGEVDGRRGWFPRYVSLLLPTAERALRRLKAHAVLVPTVTTSTPPASPTFSLPPLAKTPCSPRPPNPPTPPLNPLLNHTALPHSPPPPAIPAVMTLSPLPSPLRKLLARPLLSFLRRRVPLQRLLLYKECQARDEL
jgi:hypothetical protein